MTDATPLNGILPVDKPEGPTSHDLVARARRALQERRIGHTGTLDPFASGLLLLCVGRATRLAEYLTGLDKSYRAVVRLGASTDTDDRTGRVLATSEAWRELDEARLAEAARALEGEQMQVPPAYSAKKVEGQRMYERARRGLAVELAPVPVTVHRIAILRVELPDLELEVDCSSGTYIRAIARDLGERLWVGAHLESLRRTRVGVHDVATALPPELLDDAAAVERAWISPIRALAHLPQVRLEPAAAGAITHGIAVDAPPDAPASGEVAVLDGGELLAVGLIEGGKLRPRKVFR